MNYQETVNWLYNQLPFYQKDGVSAYKKDIDNVVEFFDNHGHDYQHFNSIHIGGTNGKGSVAHMVSSILQESGYKVGLFTSPHIIDFRERVKINGHKVSKSFIVEFIKKHKNYFEEINMSFFEMNVVMAFRYFAIKKVDLAIVEVGLGGRLDATNVLIPKLSIITNISLDHTNLLGVTIDQIAKEKSGIIKKNTPILIGDNKKYTNLIENFASRLDAEVYYAKSHNYDCDLKGIYQKKNINTSVTAIKILNTFNYNIDNTCIIKGLNNVTSNTGIMGRWQIILNQPMVICDIAHNIEAIKFVFDQISKYNLNKHVILGFSKDKNIEDIIASLPNNINYYLCGSMNPRIMSLSQISSIFEKYSIPYMSFEFAYNAYHYLLPQLGDNDILLITGSTFIVSDVLKYLDKV